MMAENGHDVAYYLGKNIKEFRRIAILEPPQQFLEIGRLSATLAAQKEAPHKPSRAPSPISPVTGNATVSGGEIKENMPFEEYRKIGNKMFRGR